MKWPVEIKYDIVKNNLELVNFSGRTVNAIMQDFWICMMLANIASIAKPMLTSLLLNSVKIKKTSIHISLM